MTDYYGILRSAIDETGADTADARATIYLRAWAALEAQFDSPDVALPDEARKQQRQLMDEAISRIEREFGATEEEASQAAAALDQDEPQAEGDSPFSPDARMKDAPVSPGGSADDDDIFEPAGDKMADQAIPDSGAATPWRAQGAAAVSGDDSEPTDRPGAPPPRETERRGRGGLVAAVIVLLVVAAGAAGAWWRWDDVQSFMAQVTPASDTSPASDQETEQAVVGKQDRAEPPAAQDGGQAGSDTTAGAPEAPQAAATEPAGGAERAQAQDPPAQQDESVAQMPDATAEAPKDQERVDDTGAVVERAYLIQESEQAGEQDLRFAGQARWTVEGNGSEAVLTIDMQVPERSQALRVTMRENNDAALPASHTIDLIYQGPNDAPNLKDVAGIMAIRDSVENAEPLRAAGALVVPGQYLMALRGSQDDRAENMERLTNSKWLAVRALFDDGKHAVFLVEKGEKGSQVLEQALNAWGDGQTGQTDSGQ